jgi:hypothetical protein
VILGLSREEVRRKYDAIVAFSGLDERFLETPVKHYSSGMYARLAMAVAAHVEPDLLLVDEVLSVGDAAFQDRSMRKMLELRASRNGVVFVSHNMAAVELMCDRAIWLERGRVRAEGATSDVVRAYLDATDDASVGEGQDGETVLSVDRVDVLDAAGQVADRLSSGRPFEIHVEGRAHQRLIEPVFVVTVRGDHGPLFAGNMHIDGNWPSDVPPGPFQVDCAFDAPPLVPGRYQVEIKVKQNVRTNYYEPRVKATFAVDGACMGPGGADIPYAMIADG